jgi:hypothetical protein
MIDRVSQAAEKLASKLSRRLFLSRLAPSVLAVAGLVGGLLAFPSSARADTRTCCYYSCGLGCPQSTCIAGHQCPGTISGFCLSPVTCTLVSSKVSPGCRQCP